MRVQIPNTYNDQLITAIQDDIDEETTIKKRNYLYAIKNATSFEIDISGTTPLLLIKSEATGEVTYPFVGKGKDAIQSILNNIMEEGKD